MSEEQVIASLEASQSPAEDAELARVLDECLEALEACRPLDAEALAAAHPAIAERLRACLASLQLVERATGELAGAVPEELRPDEPVCLGDFRLLRPVGRGGMGVVYEAEQVSLRRRVAVKVLPFAAALDPRQLQRFKNESLAAAQLHHTHIVPVYYVGCERGVHFYAMQFVEGQSLAAVIAEQRALEASASDRDRLADHPSTAPTVDAAEGRPIPAAAEETASLGRALTTRRSPWDREWFRTVAKLGIQAAEALDHAHQQGVVHRDVKPANLLVDGRGHLWVTDFGLAQVQGNQHLTLTGDLVGTLRYMSPEQALAQRRIVDHLTDVYALGATLYELLTLEPVFGGTNRQILLYQLASEEPRPPRRRNRAVPRELEIIVLKALEKNPAERYVTAQELADDLRRFLQDEPIHARRPTLVKRLARWCRRHLALAVAAGLAASLLVATAAVSIGWAVHASRLAEDRRIALRESQVQLSERHFDHALVQCEHGEIGLGLLWMAQSLRIAPDEAEDLRAALRASLAGWRSQLFALTGCYAGTGEILAFGPDGQTAWVAEPDGAVCRRVITTGAPVGLPLRHDAKVSAVAVSREGKFVLTAAGSAAYLWEAASGKPGLTFRPSGVLYAIALSADGGTVLTAELMADHLRKADSPRNETTIRLWDARSGRQLTPTCHCKHRLSTLALSPDGQTILAAQSEGILSWDVRTGQPLDYFPVHRGDYRALAWSPDGRGVLIGSSNSTARLWNVKTGQPLGPTLQHGSPVKAVAFSSDGRTVLTLDARKTIRTWEVAQEPSPAKTFETGKPLRTVDFSPDGRTVATGGFFDRKARLWNREGAAPPRELLHERAVAAVRFSPNGRTLATADWKNSAYLWDTASGQPKSAPLWHGGFVESLAFSPNGLLLVTGSSDQQARIWEVETGNLLFALPHGDRVAAVAFDPAGDRVVTGSSDGTGQVWNIATGQPSGKPLSHGSTILVVAFDPKGDRVLTAGVNGTAWLWDVATGQRLGLPMPHGSEVMVAAFSPDGRRILTGSLDGAARLWDAATGRSFGQSLAHSHEVRAAAFSRDNRWVVTGSWDWTARLWDAATSRPLGPPLPHQGKVWAVAFGAGNRMILTGSEDGKARLWQLPSPVQGSVERIVLWVQVLTGMEIDADGGGRVLDPTAWQQYRQLLVELGGPPTL